MKGELGEGARERLLRLGALALTDAELLAVLLGTGAKGCPVGELALRLLTSAGGLKTFLQQEPEELCELRGLGPARAAQVLAALELGRRAQRSEERRPRLRSAAEIHSYLAPTLSALRREVFHVLCFNPRNVLLRDARVAEGSANSCPVDPREVFAPALNARASAIVLAHNHPSGDPEPSGMDLALTAQLASAGNLLGIRVLDHLILGDTGFVSFHQRGLLAPSGMNAQLAALGDWPAWLTDGRES